MYVCLYIYVYIYMYMYICTYIITYMYMLVRAGFGDQDPDFEILNGRDSDGMMHQKHYSCTHFLTSFEDARAELKRVGSERASNTQMLAAAKSKMSTDTREGGATTLSKTRGSGVEAIIQPILFGPDTCDVYEIFGY